MIVEIPEDVKDVNVNHLTSDHCYTFKRGIRPKDLDKAKTKAAMFGEVTQSPSSSSSSQPYTFILPKNPTTQIIFQDSMDNPARLFESKKTGAGTSKETRCGKHRWLWQFMKELLFIGDTSLQWYNQREGV